MALTKAIIVGLRDAGAGWEVVQEKNFSFVALMFFTVLIGIVVPSAAHFYSYEVFVGPARVVDSGQNTDIIGWENKFVVIKGVFITLFIGLFFIWKRVADRSSFLIFDNWRHFAFVLFLLVLTYSIISSIFLYIEAYRFEQCIGTEFAKQFTDGTYSCYRRMLESVDLMTLLVATGFGMWILLKGLEGLTWFMALFASTALYLIPAVISSGIQNNI